MSDALARWLQQQFQHIADVRRATTEPDPSVVFQQHSADVVVSTWMGARLYVYLITSAPNTGDLKKILQTNTRSGIGTLFLVSARLLPTHDERIFVRDWHQVLFSLQDDFIYSYVIDPDAHTISLSQVHFTPSGSSGEYRVWHLPNFTIESVNVRRQEIQQGLRGKWYLGDIASPTYKRRVNHERVNQRFHYRTKYTRETNNSNGGASQPDENALRQALNILGLESDPDAATAKRAYRRRAMQVHPDVSALPRPEAARRFKELNKAYEYLKEVNGWD